MLRNLINLPLISFGVTVSPNYYIRSIPDELEQLIYPSDLSSEDLSPNLLDPHVKIAVVGVGGAGGNIIDRFLKKGANEGFGRKGVEFFAINTDVGALKKCCCDKKIQIGLNCTGGVGAGGVPSVGRKSAEENCESVVELLGDFHCVFLCGGMGGGTGSGALPVIAAALKEKGSLTIGVVTTPFQFEGTRRKMVAAQCMDDVEKSCDTLIVVPNENIFNYIEDNTIYNEAFQVADNVLLDGVKGVTDLITKPGLINLDFSDVKTVMKSGGRAFMGTGFGSFDEYETENEVEESEFEKQKSSVWEEIKRYFKKQEEEVFENEYLRFLNHFRTKYSVGSESNEDMKQFQRSNAAVLAALHNPLLEYSNITAAENVIVNITGSQDLTLHEVRHISELIKEIVNPSTNLLIGTSLDPLLKDRIKVSIVITGLPRINHKSLELFDEVDSDTKMLSLRSDVEMVEKKGFWAWLRRNF